MNSLYSDLRWREIRAAALARDKGRCTVARLLGGSCSASLHAHHIVPAAERPDLALDLENVATVCDSHHPTWEALRRQILRARERSLRATARRRCPHFHKSREGRRICEARLNRERESDHTPELAPV